MNYKDIFKDKRVTEEHMHKIVEALDCYAPENEDLKMKIAYILNDFHESEYTAKRKIASMEAVAYIGCSGQLLDGISSMDSYLSTIGVTPDFAHRKVMEAYDRAKTRASEKGFTAPKLDVNMWDCYASMAMVLADYWYTTFGDLDKVAMISYEYLSDPDKKR